MILDALGNALRDLATGLGGVGLGVIGYFALVLLGEFCWYRWRGGRRGYEIREARSLPEDYRLWQEQQRREQIKCMGGGRRGPEAVHRSERRAA